LKRSALRTLLHLVQVSLLAQVSLHCSSGIGIGISRGLGDRIGVGVGVGGGKSVRLMLLILASAGFLMGASPAITAASAPVAVQGVLDLRD
jgi:hypothetical protein